MVVEFYYHPQSPPCCLVWMVIKELDISHKAILVDMMKMEHREDAYKKINPKMQLPTVRDGDLTLTESRAIAVYLSAKYGKGKKNVNLYPTELTEQARFNELMMADVDNYHKMLNYLNPEAIFEGRAKGVVTELLPKCEAVLAEYEAVVTSQDYMFGKHLTFLDFACVHTLACIEMGGFNDWKKYPNLVRWSNKLRKLPYYEECVKKPTESNNRDFQQFLKEGSSMYTKDAKT